MERARDSALVSRGLVVLWFCASEGGVVDREMMTIIRRTCAFLIWARRGWRGMVWSWRGGFFFVAREILGLLLGSGLLARCRCVQAW